MAKLKIETKYGIAPNRLLNKGEASLKAKGLFTFLQSKPDGWSFSVERISKQNSDGKDSIRTAIKELENEGYLKRKAIKDKEGKWIGYDYILSEKPLSENPTTDKPTTENYDTLSKKDNSNKDIVKKKEIAKPSFAINELISLFKEINPSYEKLFSNKTQRSALERLVKKHGHEEIKKVIETLPMISKEKYAPVITTPLQLEDKLGRLIIFMRNKKKSDVSISVL